VKNHQHPWNLRRIFGRQFVGYVGRPACHEAGIAARVIPAQSSRWTSREPEDADLPTCRLHSSHSSSVSTAINSKVVDFAASLFSGPRLPFQGPAIVRSSPPVLPRGSIFLNSLFPTGNSEEPLFQAATKLNQLLMSVLKAILICLSSTMIIQNEVIARGYETEFKSYLSGVLGIEKIVYSHKSSSGGETNNYCAATDGISFIFMQTRRTVKGDELLDPDQLVEFAAKDDQYEYIMTGRVLARRPIGSPMPDLTAKFQSASYMMWSGIHFGLWGLKPGSFVWNKDSFKAEYDDYDKLFNIKAERDDGVPLTKEQEAELLNRRPISGKAQFDSDGNINQISLENGYSVSLERATSPSRPTWCPISITTKVGDQEGDKFILHELRTATKPMDPKIFQPTNYFKPGTFVLANFDPAGRFTNISTVGKEILIHESRKIIIEESSSRLSRFARIAIVLVTFFGAVIAAYRIINKNKGN
jgi:hypothetical protein